MAKRIVVEIDATYILNAPIYYLPSDTCYDADGRLMHYQYLPVCPDCAENVIGEDKERIFCDPMGDALPNVKTGTVTEGTRCCVEEAAGDTSTQVHRVTLSDGTETLAWVVTN